MANYLYIGLGNPGKKFSRTRHNLGIRVLRAWVAEQASDNLIKNWQTAAKFNADIAELKFAGTRITCLFPLTHMNNSGAAVAAYLHQRLARFWHPINHNHLLIIHDDASLPIGTIRIKPTGSAGGHNGVRSIHQSLDTKNIARLRLGIGKNSSSVTPDFVLGKFTSSEEAAIDNIVPSALKTLDNFALSSA